MFIKFLYGDLMTTHTISKIIRLITLVVCITHCSNNSSTKTTYDIGTITPDFKCYDHSKIPGCIPPIPGDKRISFTGLGIMGRFGNQLLQYIFINVYAKRHGLTIETPEWAGSRLFGIQDPGISECFCKQGDNQTTLNSYIKATNDSFPNVDFNGFFQFNTIHHASDKQHILELFQPVPELKQVVDLGVRQLYAIGDTIVAIHLRRGDFGPPPWIISPTKWYVEWLDSIWPTLKNPVLFVASDDLDNVLPDFSKFNPITLRNLSIEVLGADYYPEHYILSQADQLAISNSTFSSTAAMLNQTAKGFYRPDFNQKKLVEYDPWNSLPFDI